jgi:hypothetical protein
MVHAEARRRGDGVDGARAVCDHAPPIISEAFGARPEFQSDRLRGSASPREPTFLAELLEQCLGRSGLGFLFAGARRGRFGEFAD